MKPFEIGKEYTGSFNYDINCKVTIKIEKRTEKTISYFRVINDEKKLVTKKIKTNSECESFFYESGANFLCIRSI